MVVKKHVIPILTLLYESQHTIHDCSSVEGGKELSITNSLKSIFPNEGLQIDVSDKYPIATSIFHNFVKSELGFSTLSTCTSLNFVNPYSKLEVITDTLKCMLGTFKIDIAFSCEQDKSKPSERSLTLLGEALAALSKLNDIKLGGDLLPDVSILLHHLSTSPTRHNYTHITLHRVKLNIATMLQMLSSLKFLRWVTLKETDMVEGNKHSDITNQSYHIKHLLFQFHDVTQEQASPHATPTHQEVRLTLKGCDNDALPHHLSTLPFHYSRITFEKVMINVMTINQFLLKAGTSYTIR